MRFTHAHIRARVRHILYACVEGAKGSDKKKKGVMATGAGTRVTTRARARALRKTTLAAGLGG